MGSRSTLALGLVAVMAGTLLLVSTAAAQQAPDGADCQVIDVDPASEVTVPGDWDLVIIVLDDGTQLDFFDVADGTQLVAPDGTLIVRMLKCTLPEATPPPAPTIEPTLTPTAEPTPTVEPTPTSMPTVAPTSTPTPAPTSTPQPTATATAQPTPQVLAPTPPAPESGATPEAEVQGAQQEQLAQTGAESGWLAVLGVTLLAAGGLLVGTGITRRRI